MGRPDLGNAQKYASKNPVQRALLGRFVASAVELVRAAAPRSVLDVGCGEGFVLDALVRAGVGGELAGVDPSSGAIAHARARLPERVRVEVAGVADLPARGHKWDLVMMLEVLEHLDDPQAALAVLDSVAARHVLLSVPWEPFFRGLNLLRGRHVRTLGNHPEHVQSWGRRDFLAFVERRFRVVRAPLVFPWTLVLAEVAAGDLR